MCAFRVSRFGRNGKESFTHLYFSSISLSGSGNLVAFLETLALGMSAQVPRQPREVGDESAESRLLNLCASTLRTCARSPRHKVTVCLIRPWPWYENNKKSQGEKDTNRKASRITS